MMNERQYASLHSSFITQHSSLNSPEAQVVRIDMSDYNRSARGYWFAVVAAGSVVFAWGAYSCLSFGAAQWAQLLVLASLVVISGMLPVRIPGTKASVTAGD